MKLISSWTAMVGGVPSWERMAASAAGSLRRIHNKAAKLRSNGRRAAGGTDGSGQTHISVYGVARRCSLRLSASEPGRLDLPRDCSECWRFTCCLAKCGSAADAASAEDLASLPKRCSAARSARSSLMRMCAAVLTVSLAKAMQHDFRACAVVRRVNHKAP
eukprot:641655-Pleurochrysis_carterae.AAC.6